MFSQEMRNMNNFNGVMLVLSALNNSAVRRLKSNWEALPKSIRSTFVSLQDLLDPDDNFLNLRNALKTAESPVIPFMGLYLTQMTYIDENDDKRDGLINFNKLNLFGTSLSFSREKHTLTMPTGKVLLELKKFQTGEYPFKPIPSIQNYFLKKVDISDLTPSRASKRITKGYGKMRWWDEKEVYQQSLVVKPREPEGNQ